MKNANTEIITQTRVFSDSEIKVAENMLEILAFISADYWSEALLSDSFVPNGKLLDYERGYKDRVIKIIADPNAKPISIEQIAAFRKNFLLLANESIAKDIENDKIVAILLGKEEKVKFDFYESYLDFDFGGWDNEPVGILAKAMKLADIQGKMHIGSKYRKNRITLLKDDGTIREGWRKYSPILYRTR